MRHRDEESSSNLTIVDAVETLSNIADLEPERDVGISHKADLTILGKSVAYRTVHWLQQTDADTTLDVIKNTFRIVLRYLRSFYKEEHGYLTDAATVEGIKTIMVLVGEAAKKLDRFTKIFHGAKASSVTHLKEYKQLQEFYQKRIARKIDEGTLGKWVLALTAPHLPVSEVTEAPEVGAATLETRKVFVDLDSVKKDVEYELFFLRKDDGTRFFSPALLRNVRLVCDFGDYFGEGKGDDPLSRSEIWQDWMYQISARSILKAARKEMEAFYRGCAGARSQELVAVVNYTLMSLSMAANPRNLRRNRPVKSCMQYYVDFQVFLRATLTSREYQKLVTYPPRKTNKMAWCLLTIVNSLCEGLYMHSVGYSEMSPVISNLLEKARQVTMSYDEDEEEVGSTWWSKLDFDYQAMGKLMRRHPNGPLYKVLQYLKDDGQHSFDPLVQNNIPNLWYDIQLGERIIGNIRMPSPIRQSVIGKCVVVDEFKAALRSYRENRDPGGHLLFNLSDRTSWLEHSRCEVLERLQDKTDFSHHLRVVTLATSTDFYQQVAPYHDANHADPFMEQLQDQITGEGGGYFFPENVRATLFTSFLPHLIRGIHDVFFGGKNILVRRERLDFIQLVHMFLAIKVIELVKPDTLSFTCKDGVDTGTAFSAMVFACLNLLNGADLDQRNLDYLYVMLYGPALLVRERTMLPDRFHRAVGAIKSIAQVADENGGALRREIVKVLQPLFSFSLLETKTFIPQPIQVLY